MVIARTPTEKRLLRLLQRRPDCIRQADIVLTTDLTPYEVTQALRALRLDGLAAMTAAGGPNAAWGTPENVAAAKAARAEDLRLEAQARRARDAKRLTDAETAREARERQAEEDDAAEAFARPSVKRTVHEGWPRPAVAAPFSVFTQGAAA